MAYRWQDSMLNCHLVDKTVCQMQFWKIKIWPVLLIVPTFWLIAHLTIGVLNMFNNSLLRNDKSCWFVIVHLLAYMEKGVPLIIQRFLKTPLFMNCIIFCWIYQYFVSAPTCRTSRKWHRKCIMKISAQRNWQEAPHLQQWENPSQWMISLLDIALIFKYQ